ncbi:phytanoyl-dioxygenase family protein [Grosmannia clavigera kw1407]|uniref:Phytanoyl-dioxygenase family protein n=1 Tax=Grosmannia clavigera (strain kw1407 / UAMH 11150) TaxID=655863 RepID=F0XLN6_GROCL|nr:phytanoyl-dioxygenase family protein [Grosmannia clavigera kw1407]EFX01225.1 phytanoyl-dioxygenase family protein [Grosmannia clavigera kw1407]
MTKMSTSETTPIRPEPGALTPEQVAAFERDGYLIVADALPAAAVAALLAETHRLLDGFSLEGHPMTRFETGAADSGEGHVGDAYFLGSGDQVRFFFEADAFDGAGRLTKPKAAAVNKIGHYLHGGNEVFARVTATTTWSGCSDSSGPFPGARPVAPIARSLGFRDPRCLQSMVICKQPEIGGAVPPHQDSTFLYTDPPSAVGFWYALEDASAHNGCLSFWPGSHRRAPVRKRLVRRDGPNTGTHLVDNTGRHFPDEPAETSTSLLISPECESDASQYVLGEVKAGSLVLIHGNLLHRSEKNVGLKGRIIYTFHVIEGDGPTYDARNWLQPPAGGFTKLV